MFEHTKAGIAYDYAMAQPEGVGVIFFQAVDPEVDDEPFLLFENVRLDGYTRPTRKLARSDYGRAVMLAGAMVAARNRAQAEGFEMVA